MERGRVGGRSVRQAAAVPTRLHDEGPNRGVDFAPARGVAQGTRSRSEPAFDYLAARPVPRIPPGPGGGSAEEHAGMDHHRDPVEPGAFPRGAGNETLRGDLPGGLHPPADLDLVDAG